MQNVQLNYRPKPFEDEFYLSYLMRLAIGNGFTHWKAMADALYHKHWHTGSTYELIKMATGYSDETLDNISLYAEHCRGYSLFGKNPIKERKVVRTSIVKVCHACMQEGRHIRGAWQFVDVKHCIIHRADLNTISKDVFETRMQHEALKYYEESCVKDPNQYQQLSLTFYDDEYQKIKETLNTELIDRRSESRGNTPKDKLYREILKQINLSEFLDKGMMQIFLPNVL